MPSCPASADPARPASTRAAASSAPASSGVLRARADVRPSTCSANDFRAHPGFTQSSTRTCSRTTTGRPQTGRSRKNRAYPPCRLPDSTPQSGHATRSAAGRARTTTRSPVSATPSTTSPARCGISTESTRAHDNSPSHCDNDTAGSWLRRIRHPARYQEPAPAPPRHAERKQPLPPRDLRQNRPA